MKKVIFGGTFNPIHLGHSEIIANVAALKDVEQVIVMPAKSPPHKICADLACDADRFEMCKLATRNIDKTIVSDIELMRKGKSYTFDTLKHITTLYPHDEFALVCGGDMIVTFDQWYKFEDILDLVEIIAVRRVGIDQADFDNAVTKLINIGGRISVLKNYITGISSTQIKENINNKDYLLKYLDKDVYDYIFSNGLYGANK